MNNAGYLKRSQKLKLSVQELLITTGMTQRAIAEKLGISHRYCAKLCRDIRNETAAVPQTEVEVERMRHLAIAERLLKQAIESWESSDKAQVSVTKLGRNSKNAQGQSGIETRGIVEKEFRPTYKDPKCLQSIVNLQERIARLKGLDSPREINIADARDAEVIAKLSKVLTLWREEMSRTLGQDVADKAVKMFHDLMQKEVENA